MLVYSNALRLDITFSVTTSHSKAEFLHSSRLRSSGRDWGPSLAATGEALMILRTDSVEDRVGYGTDLTFLADGECVFAIWVTGNAV